MKRWVLVTAVALFGILFVAVGCAESDPAPKAPDLPAPAFLYFYTDN